MWEEDECNTSIFVGSTLLSSFSHTMRLSAESFCLIFLLSARLVCDCNLDGDFECEGTCVEIRNKFLVLGCFCRLITVVLSCLSLSMVLSSTLSSVTNNISPNEWWFLLIKVIELLWLLLLLCVEDCKQKSTWVCLFGRVLVAVISAVVLDTKQPESWESVAWVKWC